MWESPPEGLVSSMQRAGLRRAFLVTPPAEGRVQPSHAAFASLAEAVSADERDYRAHEGCFFEIGEESGHLLSAFLHWTRRGQGAGGVRLGWYDTVEGLVRDGLRLSRGMGQKNALAGLWWGGGKGVIARQSDRDYADRGLRDAIYRDYGRFVSGLSGCYVTAEDAGTTPADMAAVHQTTRFTTCIPEALGGSGNPSRLTAAGVVVGMEAALQVLGLGGLKGKTVALQGLGNVGRFLVGELAARGVEGIVAADIEEAHIEAARREHPDAPLSARLVSPSDESILAEACDVLSPNALGATLNQRTIPRIRARVVCGGANNQLEDPVADAHRLHQRGVVYVPDFLANRMGIVNCANEQYGRLPDDPAIGAHLRRDHPEGIFRRTVEILERSAAGDRPIALEAESLADELSRQEHPIWPHRGQQIISGLVAGGWSAAG